MKLTKSTEWVLLGALILYIVFTPGFSFALRILSNPIGNIAALVGIVYVWKNISALAAVLLVILYVKCTRMAMREMFSGAEDTCICEGEGFTWDKSVRKCRNAEGKDGTVKSCTCIAGYSWDGGPKGTQECVPTSGMTPPVDMPADNPVASALEAETAAAPAVSTGPATSTAPMTTPGAVQDMVSTTTAPGAPDAGGVQPTASGGTASTPAPM